MEIDENAVELMKALGEAVKELPEAVQARAFEYLLQSRVDHSKRVGGGAEGKEGAGVPAGEWAKRLAEAAGVSKEHVMQLFASDESGVHLISGALGHTEAERTRNAAVLLVWSARVLEQIINYPLPGVRKALTQLGVTGNVDREVSQESLLRVTTVKGKKCLQLSGDWKKRAKELIEHHA